MLYILQFFFCWWPHTFYTQTKPTFGIIFAYWCVRLVCSSSLVVPYFGWMLSDLNNVVLIWLDVVPHTRHAQRCTQVQRERSVSTYFFIFGFEESSMSLSQKGQVQVESLMLKSKSSCKSLDFFKSRVKFMTRVQVMWLKSTTLLYTYISNEGRSRPHRRVDARQTVPLGPIGSFAQQRRCA